MTNLPKEPWHLDKRVPIATLMVLIVQFALGVMWITTLSNQVTAQAAALIEIRATAVAHEARIRSAEIAQAGQSSDLRSIQIGISEIKAQLDRMQAVVRP